MNAPRQGLFASLLIISFAVHVTLMIHATNQQLSNTRAIQGELMTRQLADDSLAMLAPVDTVSLALMANRYSSRPDVSALKIMAADNRVLATSGSAPTRSGEIFNKKIMLDQQPIGKVELTLIKPSIGELIRMQWPPILLSLLVHALLWLLYRVVARPTRREYLQSLAREQQLQEQMVALKLHAEMAQKNAMMAQALANPNSVPKPDLKAREEIGATSQQHFTLLIDFVDPKQLLGTLSPGLAQPYFNLCQTLLEQAITQTQQYFAPHRIDYKIEQHFSSTGAVISAPNHYSNGSDANSGNANSGNASSVLFLTQVAKLFNLLTEVVYKRHRELKRFALQTRATIAESQTNQSGQSLAHSLMTYMQANQLAVHASDEQLLTLQQHFELSPLDNPTDAQTREAVIISAMKIEQAQFIREARERILGRNKNTDPKVAADHMADDLKADQASTTTEATHHSGHGTIDDTELDEASRDKTLD